MKILVADDDRVARTLLKRCLEGWGYEVVAVEDGVRAWEALESDGEIRVAVLDWMMPGFDGVAICAKLLELSNRPGVYTILVTVRDEPSDLLHALQRGANCFLAKPVNLAVLRAHVEVGCRLAESEDKLVRLSQQLENLANERARRLVESETLARTDPLTGALNRRGYTERCTVEFDRAVRNERPLSVLKVDLDHFKGINDTFGHDAGDEVLKRVVNTFEIAIREVDVVGRIGGEEFEILLPETDLQEALLVGERMRDSVEGLEVLWQGQVITVTISTGVTALRPADQSLTA